MAELVGDLGHPNLTVRLKATNQLVERGPKCAEAVQALFKEPAANDAARHTWEQAHGLWVLERVGLLDEATLSAACRSPADPRARPCPAHRGREANLSPGLTRLARAALKDPDANVQRAAADALGRHPDPDNIRPLLDLRQHVPPDDTHLLHAVRMALRDQLRDAAHWARLPTGELERPRRQSRGRRRPGVPTAEAAAYLMRQLEAQAMSRRGPFGVRPAYRPLRPAGTDGPAVAAWSRKTWPGTWKARGRSSGDPARDPGTGRRSSTRPRWNGAAT